MHISRKNLQSGEDNFP